MSPGLEGIIPPIVTPFSEDEEILDEPMREEIRYHLNAGVHGISVGGTSGEGNALTLEEHTQIYEIAVDEAGDEVPIVAGAIATSGREAAAKAKRAREAGADYVMATPPHYMTPTDQGIIDYFHQVGEVGQLPILIYDVVDHVDITAELAAEINRVVPELYGIKQSGGDFHGLSNMIDKVGDELSILTALDDILFSSFQLGADGAISGTTAIYPRICVELWEAVQNGNLERGKEIHFATHQLARVASFNAQQNFPGSPKAAIELLGREAGEARVPIRLPDEEKRQEIEDAIEHMREHGVYENPQLKVE